VPFLDEKTGLVSRGWYCYLSNLYVLAGSGSVGISTADILLAPFVQQDTDDPEVTTVDGLMSAAAAGAGARSFVTDANATLTAGIGTVVVGGGTNGVPVTCDGTDWRIG
jgi:hypothetical protein